MQLTSLVYSVLAAEAAGEKSIPDQLGINGIGLLFQAVAFGLLLFVLARFAYRPFLKVIDERRARAQEIVERSEQMKRELNETQSRSKAELEKARAEAQAILTEARETRDRIVGDARRAAEEAATEVTKKAQEQITAEREKAFADLRRETAELAIYAATRVVGHELQTSEETRRRLVNDALVSVEKNGAVRNN